MAMITYRIYDPDYKLMASDVAYTSNPERVGAVKRIDHDKVRELAFALDIPGGSHVKTAVYTQSFDMPDASKVRQHYQCIWI